MPQFNSIQWMRQNKINILKYLPEFLSKDINFKSVADVNSQEHEKIRLAIQDIFNQFFISTATWGLDSYEKILGITPKATDDYIARRNMILARYQANQTSTITFLETLVKRYIIPDTPINITEDNTTYSFKVNTNSGSVLYLTDMINAIDLYKPAHLCWLLHYNRKENMDCYCGCYVKIAKKITIKAVN